MTCMWTLDRKAIDKALKGIMLACKPVSILCSAAVFEQRCLQDLRLALGATYGGEWTKGLSTG